MMANESKEEQIRKILRPLSHEKIIDILADLGASVPGAFDKIYNAASMDVATRKIFVRGLGQTTTADSLFTLFSQYGEVQEVNLIKDKTSGQPKGYGFVTMHSIEDADAAVLEPTKIIDGRQVFCNLAALRNPPQNGHMSPTAGNAGDKKIFVHGLGSELTEQMLHEQFEKYGEVEEVNVVMDKHSNRSKGYGFVTFKDVASMMRALEYPEKQVNGKTLKCEMAGKPKQLSASPVPRPMSSQSGPQGGPMGGAPGQPPMLGMLHHSHSNPQLSGPAAGGQLSPSSPPVLLAHPHHHPHHAGAGAAGRGSQDHSMFAYASHPGAGVPLHLNGPPHHHGHPLMTSMVQPGQGRGASNPGVSGSGAPATHVTSVADGWSSQRFYFPQEGM